VPTTQDLLDCSAARHDHLCPRQVLGVRMGIAGMQAVGVEAPFIKSTGLVIVETDGCFVDGIEVSTGATVGHRTLRVNDYGKIAATFVNVLTGRAVRLAPRAGVRAKACEYAPFAGNRYDSQIQGYSHMPLNDLFRSQSVLLTPPLQAIISQAEFRVECCLCGEEIFNGREIRLGDAVLCESCAAGGYYSNEAERSKRPQIEEFARM
jgi:formylmethanofuran dehydrogenase subunit E